MPNAASNQGNKPIVLAYSGGLDTSFLVPWVAENYGRPIITVTVDTGGSDDLARLGHGGMLGREMAFRFPPYGDADLTE